MLDSAKKAKGGAKKKPANPSPKKMGRPPEAVPQAMAEEICEWIAQGKTLREFCRQDGKPAWQTVYGWLDKDAEFRRRFAHARERGEEAIAQECLNIADSPVIGEEIETTDDGRVKVKRGDMLGHRKLQIETRLKLLAKWNPKKWGDKVDLNHGGQPENPVQTIKKIIKIPEKQVAEVVTSKITGQAE